MPAPGQGPGSAGGVGGPGSMGGSGKGHLGGVGKSRANKDITLLDKVLGYDTVDQRKAAYRNNPAAKAKGSATVPNFPNADIGYALTKVIGGMASIGSPIGIGMQIAGNSGYGFDLGKALGFSPGKQEGTTDAGRINDQGDPGVNRDEEELRRKKKEAASKTLLGQAESAPLGYDKLGNAVQPI